MGKWCGVGRDECSPIKARQDARLQEGGMTCAGMRAATPFPTDRHTFPPRGFPPLVPLIMPRERPRRKHTTALLIISTRPDTIDDDPPHIRPFPRPLIHSPTRAKGVPQVQDVHLLHVSYRSFSEIVTAHTRKRHERWSVVRVPSRSRPPVCHTPGGDRRRRT